MAEKKPPKQGSSVFIVFCWCTAGGATGFLLGGLGGVVVDSRSGGSAGSMGVNPLVWALPLALTIAGFVIGAVIGSRKRK